MAGLGCLERSWPLRCLSLPRLDMPVPGPPTAQRSRRGTGLLQPRIRCAKLTMLSITPPVHPSAWLRHMAA